MSKANDILSLIESGDLKYWRNEAAKIAKKMGRERDIAWKYHNFRGDTSGFWVDFGYNIRTGDTFNVYFTQNKSNRRGDSVEAEVEIPIDQVTVAELEKAMKKVANDPKILKASGTFDKFAKGQRDFYKTHSID